VRVSSNLTRPAFRNGYTWLPITTSAMHVDRTRLSRRQVNSPLPMLGFADAKNVVEFNG
jgi:hypothetical protein